MIFRISPSPFSQRESFSKTYPSFLTVKEGIFRKPTRPSLPLRKAPPLTPTLSPQERGRKPPSGAQNRYAIRLADHQRSSPCFAGWDRRKTEYLYNELTVKILISTYNILKYQNAILLNFRLVSIFLTYSLET